MTDPGAPRRRNYLTRAVGVIVCFAPVALFVTSLLFDLLSTRESWLERSSVIGLAIGSFPLPCLNFYLTFVRPWRHIRRHGSLQGIRNVSVVPLLGTILIVLGGIFGFGDWRSATIGLVAVALDTGGLPWCLLATWHDHSFWDDYVTGPGDTP